jgi:hypothetical protein
MAYLVANEFQLGLDLRKAPITAPASSFRLLEDCVINPGGEIQKRKAFVKLATIADASIIGGIAGDNDKFFVFKKGTASTTPVQITGPLYSLGIAATPGITRVDSYQPWAAGYVVSGDAGDQVTRRILYNGAVIAGAGAANSNAWRARVYQGKVYAVAGQLLNFSALNNPANWDSVITPANGSGFINVSGADQFSGEIISIDRFYNSMAVFGVNDIQIWKMDPDPKLNSLQQSVSNAGLIAPRAHAQYSSGDVLFVARSGIRSLKARDASNYAVTADVGSPVDTIVTGWLTANLAGFRYSVKCVVEPESGSFWMAYGNQILVFSFFPTSKISAWSRFTLPFTIDDMAVNREKLAIRSGNDVYLYGGQSGTEYDDTETVILTPFLDATQPATWKSFEGLDVGCSGTWSIRYNINPNNPAALVQTSTVTGSTFQMDRVPAQAAGTHIQLEFRCRDIAPSVLSSFIVHYTPVKED